MTHLRTPLVYLSIAACISVAQACGGASDKRASADAVTVPSGAGDSSAPVRPSPAPDAAISTGSHVALDGAGLTLVSAESGSTRAIAFGTPADQALAAVAALLGEPIVRTTNEDCGAGPLEFIAFDGGLFVAVQQDRFVGWTARPSGSKKLRTMSNIGLGSTRTELDGAYNVRVTRSSLGTEFMAGGLQGVLASDAANAPITDLWAGANCVAR